MLGGGRGGGMEGFGWSQVRSKMGGERHPPNLLTGGFLSSAETLFSGIFLYTPSPLLSDYESSDT
jgi:hypothetical protein